MFKFHSVKFKIGFLYTALLGLFLIFFSATLYFSIRYLLYRNLDRSLQARSQEIVDIINAYSEALGQNRDALASASRKVIRFEGVGNTLPADAVSMEKRLLDIMDRYDLRRDFIRLMAQGGVVVSQSENLPVKPLDTLLKRWGASFLPEKRLKPEYHTADGFRTILVPVRFRDGRFYSLQVATPIDSIEKLLQDLLIFAVISLGAFLTFAGFMGWFFASRVLRPVEKVTAAARKITYENLTDRVEENAPDEEMKSLVGAFNDMIARLEKSFKAISEFSAHVAHELKTPLAVMRGESELAVRRERSPEEYQKVLNGNLAEIEGLIRVIDDMLLLTTLDYDPQAFRFQKVDLTAFLKDISEAAEILARRKNIRVSVTPFSGPVWVSADPVHLRRLFLNLIENAVKFTRENERIGIFAILRDKKAQIEISDTGPGIPDQDLPRIFEKFFHRERTVNPGTPSHGLGLSIALSIAKAHQGDIQVKTHVGKGSVFTVQLPLFRS